MLTGDVSKQDVPSALSVQMISRFKPDGINSSLGLSLSLDYKEQQAADSETGNL